MRVDVLKVHYAPLMMSQKESPRNHPWVLPKRVASLVGDSFYYLSGRADILLIGTRKKMGDSFYYSLGRAEILMIGRRKQWVIPG